MLGRARVVHERHVTAHAVRRAARFTIIFPLVVQGLQDEIGAAMELPVAVLVELHRVAVTAEPLRFAEGVGGLALVKGVADRIVQRAEVGVPGLQAVLKTR